MAQYRQGGGGGGGGHYANGMASSSADHVSIGVRAQSQYKPSRNRRSGRSDKSFCKISSIGAIIVVLSCVLAVTVLAYYYISSSDNNSELDDRLVDDDSKNDADFLGNVPRGRVVEFGQGSVHGRDSRYWDKDDRRRDGDYNEDDVDHDIKEAKEKEVSKMKIGKDSTSHEDPTNSLNKKGTGLYNEDGRNELKIYEAEYEASQQKTAQARNEHEVEHKPLDDEDHGQQNEGADTDNEYDDGIDSHDSRVEDYDDPGHENGDQVSTRPHDEDGRELSNVDDAETTDQNVAKEHKVSENMLDKSLNTKTSGNVDNNSLGNVDNNSRHSRLNSGQSTTKSKKKKHKRGCEMKFLNSTTQLVEPFESRKFARFALQYNEREGRPEGDEQWEPKFAGHQSLEEREESFLAHDQKINCGFVNGPEESTSTGFDLSEDDESYISRCHIAVISCIFGNSDRLRSPPTKTITRLSRKNVCFVMFMDELTLKTLTSEGHAPDTAGFIGFWKVVVVKSLPYADMRRVGKIPKLLPHRLFPSARYSIWLDSKLRLQMDPLIILEYFLWRKGYEYAISNHYDRHCVWEEVAQNKRLNKYNHTVIDQQFAFYQADGLKKFDPSDPNKLLPSNVPEGSLIVRAHTPMSNLFSCLWFNEVERFTPRDQLSFAYTYQKLRRMNPEKPFHLHMFKDCERRAVAKLFRHRSDEKRNILRQQAAE